MIIDYKQYRDQIDISFVNSDRNIDVLSIPFDKKQIGDYTREYHNFIECEEYDDQKFEGLKSLYGKPIKLEPSKKFEHHNINYFFEIEIPKYMPEYHKLLEPVLIPRLFSVDIETDITDKYGYSNQVDVENPIRSISFTSEEMNSVLFIVKDEKTNKKELNDFDWGYIDNIITEALGQYATKYEYKKNIFFFDSEIEMLEQFISVNRKYFHALIGWNFLGYDVQYIFNRCIKLNIDYKKISPTYSLTNLDVSSRKETKEYINAPTHRIYIDYMMLFKRSLVYNNLGKYSLDFVTELVLGIKKVSYDGNLRKLYEDDYLRFIAYAYVDTILVMLLHHAVNLVNIDFFQSYYTGIPYLKIGQNSISESLVFKQLLANNKFLLDSEKSTEEIRPYAGGYVKAPTTKNVEAVMGLDYNSLYPNSMITCGISPEKFITKIAVDELGRPLTEQDKKLWEKYKQMGYCLCPTGSIYDINEEGIYTIIEKNLLAERKIFKGHKQDIYLNISEKIQNEINKRK